VILNCNFKFIILWPFQTGLLHLVSNFYNKHFLKKVVMLSLIVKDSPFRINKTLQWNIFVFPQFRSRWTQKTNCTWRSLVVNDREKMQFKWTFSRRLSIEKVKNVIVEVITFYSLINYNSWRENN